MMHALELFARRQLAFYRKAWLVESTYKLGFAVRLLGGILPLLFFYFLAKIVDPADPRLRPYGGDYFAFVTIGVGLAQYFGRASGASVRDLRDAQLSGVLEASLNTRTSPTWVVLHEVLGKFTLGVLHLVVVLVAAVLLFGVDLSQANWPVAMLGFVGAFVAFVGLTMLASGVIVHWKSAETAHALLGGLGSFLAGSYFPLSVFPAPLRTAAELLPMTHSLDVLRAALLKGASLDAVAVSLVKIALLAMAAATAGVWFFSWAVREARRNGTLSLH